ncbi:hypothetical protein EMIT051CA3_30552 [Pseudomonas chlororaphis]
MPLFWGVTQGILPGNTVGHVHIYMRAGTKWWELVSAQSPQLEAQNISGFNFLSKYLNLQHDFSLHPKSGLKIFKDMQL